jgi:hypothetical protein
MGASGSINYSANSGSHYSAASLLLLPDTGSRGARRFRNTFVYEKPSTTTTIPGQLTVKYFQRVYDAGTSGYCYYTKTEIDPTPSAGETTPNYTGAISDHSVVKILEIF